MLSSFNMIKSYFGPDDPDSEKFFNERRAQRKSNYNPKFSNNQNKRKKKKNKERKHSSRQGSDSLGSLEEALGSSTDPESSRVKRKMTLETEMDITTLLLSDNLEVVEDFEVEYDYGNREYKLKLCEVDSARLEELVTQMKFRLEEGGGECFYEIGVEDNGHALGLPMEELVLSIENLKRIVEKLDADARVVKLHKGKVGLIAEIIIKRKEIQVDDKLEIKVGLLGEEGSGKSTLVGVLISNRLDNGQGNARYNVFRHKHEILCGKTSSISHQILGFDDNGETTNYGSLEQPSWAQIVHKSSKIINFYDMSGTNKNFKKTMSAFSPNYLDYLFIVISAEEQISENTEDLLNFCKQNVNVAALMNLPIVVLFTKSDLVAEDEIKDLLIQFKYLCGKLKIKKVPLVMKSDDDIVLFSRNVEEKISNIKWEGLKLIKTFLSLLPKKDSVENEQRLIDKEKTEFDIHETLAVDDKLIVTGIINKGKVAAESKCYLGPDNQGEFKVVDVVNVHCKKILSKYAYKGQYCSLYLKAENGLTKEDVRKGMVLLDKSLSPSSTWLFEAEIWTIDGSKKAIKYTYQPILNIKHVRQGCKIRDVNEISFNETDDEEFAKLIEDDRLTLDGLKEAVDKSQLSKKKRIPKMKSKLPADDGPHEVFLVTSTSKSKVAFEFMYNPEYLTVGSHIIINDQLLKAYGTITKLYK